MTGNILGERYVVLSFGESHGRCVGVAVDGCPAGLRIDAQEIQRELDLRRPGQSIVTTTRTESDTVEILSGIFEGHTTGAPICMLIWNKDVRSEDYKRILNTPRPGHADFFARMKYGGFNDWRGGGRFSGRITAGYVMAGAIAKKLMAETLGMEIIAYTLEIGGITAENFTLEDARRERYSNEVRAPDARTAEKIRRKIIEVREQGDSLGGIIECVALNMPTGLGEPRFSSLDADLGRALLSIPATKGVEFGTGFRAARMKGSENNDPFAITGDKVGTMTNNAGGIIGGLSTGMPLVLRVAFKPASSIGLSQKTVDLEKLEETEIRVPGRHDPCVVPRAVPIVENVVAIVLADHALRAGMIPPVLSTKS